MHRAAATTAAWGFGFFAAGLVLPFVAPVVERRLFGPSRTAPLEPLAEHPSLEVVVPAYLETSTIAGTARSLLAALRDYPGESSVTVVASDPETAAAAREVPGVDVVETGREGKPAAANRAVERSRADVVVFTDANCTIEPPQWPQLAVDVLRTAHLVSAHKKEQSSGESTFWRYEETAKKRAPAQEGSIAVVGEFLATRRVDYLPVPAGSISDDVWLAGEYSSLGRRVEIHDVITTWESAPSAREQWHRRTRIARGQLSEQLPLAAQLSRSPAGRLYLAHKIYRLTLGNLGFWVGVGGVAAAAPPLSTLVLPAMLAVALRYAGLWGKHGLRGPLVVLGMQAVPPVAVAQILARRLGPLRGTKGGVGWHKVSR